MVIRAFVGFDSREREAFEVCRRSMIANASAPVLVEPLIRDELQAAGLYRRKAIAEGGQYYDRHTGDTLSTEFTFTRYLVPALCQWQGWALFCDSDFLWRGDVAELMALADPRFAVMCVKHDHYPAERVKMRGQVQTRYERKNWSSLMLFNCAHMACKMLTPWQVNMADKEYLHGMRWAQDSEIGALPEVWNWLEGYSPAECGDPRAVHFTRGTPDMPGFEGAQYASEWRRWSLGDRP